jgi:DNA-binding CsgD family transcriptional regulator
VRNMKGTTIMTSPHTPLPPDFDPWTPVSYDDLPSDLVVAFQKRDWAALLHQLRSVMDGVTTDGQYGRQLIQLVRQLPLGVDPLFDRYRAVTAIDYGDWDDLQNCLALQPIEAIEIEGLRDIWLAPLQHTRLPRITAEHQAVWFGLVEAELQRSPRLFRFWAKRTLRSQFTEIVFSRDDIPAERHLLYRRLLDVMFLGVAEAHGGRLTTASSLLQESQRLGDEREQIRVFARDLAALVQVAMGQTARVHLEWPYRVASRTGLSPFGTWETLNNLMPFISLVDQPLLEWCSRLTERIANRMASPRAQLQAEAWIVAGDILRGVEPARTELAGLLMRARHASPGLRTLPQLLDGYATPRYSAFAEALDLARRCGNVWAQLSALAWMTALNPTPWTSRSLFRLIEVTGWRRLLFVPPQVSADAALGLTMAGMRGRGIIELASESGRPIITLEIASRHVDDERAPGSARIAALQALARLGTSRSRDILERVSRRKDDLGAVARTLTSRPAGVLLSEREVEVLSLTARGMTNREIGGHLGLSEHTIARHISNARTKLGAANRVEAVSMLAEMSRN